MSDTGGRPAETSGARESGTLPLLEVRDLHKHFPLHRGLWWANQGAARRPPGAASCG